jgi:hypothetical protein
LVVSEGTHEGNPDEERPQALRCLVQRVLPVETEYVWRSIRQLPRGNPIKGKGGGHFKLALKAMMVAAKESFDGLILVTDADGRHDRLGQFEQAQESEKFSIPRALGLPVEEFDAWILADRQALSQVLAATIADQGAESLRHPKKTCQRLLVQHNWNGSQAEFYEAVCQCADFQVVADRCPLGFAPFLQRLRSLDAALRRL